MSSFEISQLLENTSLFDLPGTTDHGDASWPTPAQVIWENLTSPTNDAVQEVILEFAENIMDEDEDDETGYLAATTELTAANILNSEDWTCIWVHLPIGIDVWTFWNSKIEHLGLFSTEDGVTGSFLPV